jgi:hypothetical protein
MTRPYSRQRGMTAIGMMLVLAIGAFFFYFAILLFPAYYGSFQVGSALESMGEERGLGQKPQSEIVKLLKRRFEAGYVSDVDPTDVIVEKLPTGVRLSLSYDVEKDFIGNLSLVAHFEKEVEVGN